ncbi:MAG: hypothetical protein IT552_00980 [Sphingomonadaceae bacterium]|nr:hypothetical protein [Sphingomonadaceae bacterium]
MSDRIPEYLQFQVGNPPRKVMLPSSVLTIRPGDSLGDIKMRIADDDSFLKGDAWPVDEIVPRIAWGNEERVEQAVFHSLPLTLNHFS